MKSLLLALGLIVCLDSVATVVLKEQVSFDPNSVSLSENHKQILSQLIPLESNFFVEKIDIEGYCDLTGMEDLNPELSLERASQVYEFLTHLYPDRGDYEIRNLSNEFLPLSKNPAENRCVVVTVYLLELEAYQPLPYLPQRLFPEEFPDGIPEMDTSGPISLDDMATSEGPKPQSEYIPEELKPEMRFNIENIYFYGNSAKYKKASEKSLNELLEFMLYYPDIEIQLVGHVNGNMGSHYLKKAGKTNPERKAYKNAEDLSLARTLSVKDFLSTNGVDTHRIHCIGKGGKEKLYKHPKTAAEHQANRRIEVILINK